MGSRLTSCLMEFKGNVGINTKGEVVVDDIEWQILLALFVGLYTWVLFHLQLPSVQLYYLTVPNIG